MAVVILEKREANARQTEVWLSKDGTRARVLVETDILDSDQGLSVLEIMADHAISVVRAAEDRAKLRLGD